MALLFLLIFSLLCVSSAQGIVVEGYVTKTTVKDIEKFYEKHKGAYLDKFLKALDIDNYTITGESIFIGKNYKLEDISVRGNIVFLDSTVERISGLRTGMKIKDINIDKTKENIEHFYHDNGYIEAKVNDIKLVKQRVLIHITEGKLYIVDAVNVENMDIKLHNMPLLKLTDKRTVSLPMLSNINIVPMVFNKETISYYEKQLRYVLNKKGFFDSKTTYYYKDSQVWHPFVNLKMPFSTALSVLPNFHKGIILTFKIDYGSPYNIKLKGIDDATIKEKIIEAALNNIKAVDVYNMRNLEYTVKQILSDNLYMQPDVNILIDNSDIVIDTHYKKEYKSVSYKIKYKHHLLNSFLDEFLKSVKLSITNEAYSEEFTEFIKTKLMEAGYFNPVIDFKTIDRGDNIVVKANIDEGHIYKIGKVYVNSKRLFKDVNVIASKKNVSGQEDAAKAILSKKYLFGYFKLKKTELNNEKWKVNIYLESNLREIYLKDIYVYNDLVYKSSIRRYFGKSKNITNSKISEVRDMLRRQSHIRSYNMTPLLYDDNKTDLIINAEETKKNQFFGSITYDSVDDLGLTVGYRQKNFLNLKHMIELTAGITSREEYFNANLMGFDVIAKKINNNISYNYRDRDEDDYQYNLNRFNFALNRFGNAFYLGTSVFVETIDIYGTDYSEEVKDLFLNKYNNLGFKFNIKYFMVDNKLSPKNGAIFNIDFTPVNFFKEKDFYKYEASLSLYKTIYEKFLFASNNEIGSIAGKNISIPLNYRYTLGGPNRMKAYDYRDIGTEDSRGNVYGGKNYYYAIAFLGYNIAPFVYIGPFYEVGDAFENFKSAKSYEDVGVMLDLKTTMGSFIMSYAYNPEDTNKSRQAFYISFSTAF